MKKFILLFALVLTATFGTCQVIFNVDPPSPNSGNYGFTFASGASWGVHDLTDPANTVSGELCMADDGTAADSLACMPVMANVSGKVAVLYRGDCEFGVKAFNCQTAGAIAVIIINNLPGAPVEMGGGSQGINVTVPVIMISNVDGAALKAEAEACSGTTVFIGSKSGFYNSDLGFYPQHILRAKRFGNLQALSHDASEFEVELGGWVFNYGSEDQTNVTLTVDITGAGTFTNTSTPEALIASGDSVFMNLATFTQASYANGYYDVVYTIDSDSTDEFPDDNMLPADFMMSDSLFSYARLDASSGTPISDAYFRATDTDISNSTCIAFVDPNASRVEIQGITYSASTSQNPDPTIIDGEFIEVFAYFWNDGFVDINDANFAITQLNEVASGEYIYEADLQGDSIYIPFDVPIELIDDQRYLFCVTHYGANVFIGHETEQDYNWNVETYSQPMHTFEADGAFASVFPQPAIGFGSDVIPALSVNMRPSTIGIEENQEDLNLIAYPNPANTLINIPVSENYGAIELTIMDMSGKVVLTQNIEMVAPILTVNVSSLASGSYIFNLLHGDENQVITVNINK